MEIKKRNVIINLLLILVPIIIIFLLSHNTIKDNNEKNNYLEKNGLFTIGKVIEYGARTGGVNGGSSAFIKIAYKVKGIEYKIESDYNVPSENGPEKGSEFMALYLLNEPENCALLFDYPIKDSLDYKHYIEEFKTKRPTLGN